MIDMHKSIVFQAFLLRWFPYVVVFFAVICHTGTNAKLWTKYHFQVGRLYLQLKDDIEAHLLFEYYCC